MQTPQGRAGAPAIARGFEADGFRALFEALPVSTYAWRSQEDDLVLVAFNEAAVEASRGRAAAWLGTRASDVYATEPEILSDLRAVAGGGPPLRREMPYTIPDTDEAYRLDVTYVPVPPDLVMVHIEDVTAERALEEELRATVERLRAADLDRRRLLADLMTVQEEERRRIAIDVHDDVIQVMTAISLQLETLRRAPRAPAPELRRVEEEVASVIERLRRLTFDLHPGSIERLGLAQAVRGLLAHDAGPEVETAIRLEVEPPAELSAHAYRIVREAVSNARRHANASRIDVLIEGDGRELVVRVADDGSGFDPSAGRPESLGFLGMQRRVELLGGTIEITSAPGAGTVVEARLPWGHSSPR